MTDVAISVQNLTKIYKLYDSPKDRIKGALHPLRRQYHKDFYALKDVSFEIIKGETLGIIGKNGSGKSTLLKILTGVLTPSSGTVLVNGKISALLELGAGFNPELTGLENVYFNGLISGLTRKEIDLKLQAILSFADIGEYVCQPVKTYSSGMFVRLAFAVAIAVDPDILIIDEALAVGDISFQLKCLQKLDDFRSNGVTILFVSHDISVIKKFCTKALWLNTGKIMFLGKSNEVVDKYNDYTKLNYSDSYDLKNNNKINNFAKINKISLHGKDSKCSHSFFTEDDIFVTIEYDVISEINDLVIGIAIFDFSNKYLCGLNSKIDKFLPSKIVGKNIVVLKFNSIKLLGGSYFIDVGLFEGTTIVSFDYISKAIEFEIIDESNTEGFVKLDHYWFNDLI